MPRKVDKVVALLAVCGAVLSICAAVESVGGYCELVGLLAMGVAGCSTVANLLLLLFRDGPELAGETCVAPGAVDEVAQHE